MWIEYDLETGDICATNSRQVSDDDLLILNRGQIEVSEFINSGNNRVDLTTLQVIQVTS